jgi:hypothetical protein
MAAQSRGKVLAVSVLALKCRPPLEAVIVWRPYRRRCRRGDSCRPFFLIEPGTRSRRLTDKGALAGGQGVAHLA